MIKSVCVYCGARNGVAQVYLDGATEMGRTLAEHNIRLIYGGGSNGLMGALADAVLAAGGEAVGIVPEPFKWGEVTHTRLTELHLTADMHTRKAKMASLADAFIALPGGFGTFDELMEIVTWAQIGVHGKPIAIYNIDGYYDPLLQMVERGLAQGFIPATSHNLLKVADTPQGVLDQLMSIYRL